MRRLRFKGHLSKGAELGRHPLTRHQTPVKSHPLSGHHTDAIQRETKVSGLCYGAWIGRWIALALAIFPVALVALMNQLKGISIQYLMADPSAILSQPFYLGFLSNLGILLWSAMATVCFLTASILINFSENRQEHRFLVWSGGLVLWLGLDDVFLMHEEFFPIYLGIPEKLVYATYAAFVLTYLWQFKGVIRRSNYRLLAIAFTCFFLSISLDILNPPGIDPYFFEDGFKYLGLVAWLTYFWQTAVDFLRSHYRPS